MSNIIKIKKGLDIPIRGVAQDVTTEMLNIAEYAVKPTDFVGVTPKLLVAEGDVVKAGTPLFFDKNNALAQFVSPVSGTVKAIVRGEKRKLLAVVVASDGKNESEIMPKFDMGEKIEREQLQRHMVKSGLWTLIRRRPFGTVAMEQDAPKAVFVSLFDSAPLAANMDYVLKGRKDDLHMGIRAMLALTDGELHLGLCKDQALVAMAEEIAKAESRVKVHLFQGPHPAGNVGTQIAAISPINKGEIVWTVEAQNLAVMGQTLRTGIYRPEKLVAFAGPCAAKPAYYKVISGVNVAEMFKAQCANYTECDVRLISGNVLSGTQIAHDGFLGMNDNLLSTLPEGDYYDFMGWLMPGFKKFSFSRTFLSGFFAKCCCTKKCGEKSNYTIDTNLHGEWRPMVVTGAYEQVFPFKIYPMQLIKAAIIGDIDLMENLGIYEVEPEDLALCEFVDTSKTEIQTIIREALEKIRKEAM